MTDRRAIALMVLAGALAAACASNAPDIEIQSMVSTAESAADHRRIAAYYREQAAQSVASASAHRYLAEQYGDRQNWGVAFTERARQHCDQLARSKDEAAAQYEFLAVQHETLAQKRSSMGSEQEENHEEP